MRLFFVCKQFQSRRDFIGDRYGRLWHLPAELARRGHTVSGFATSYQPRHAAGLGEGSLTWYTGRLHLISPGSWWAWRKALLARAGAHAPEVVVAASDALQLAAGKWLAAVLGVPLAVDFSDNYESYRASALPGATAAIRSAARHAAATIFASDPLREALVARYGLSAPTLTVENAVDDLYGEVPGVAEARRTLKLPVSARLIGTAGALDRSRNIRALYGAFERLAGTDPQLYLVLAGVPEVAPPPHPRVLALGTLGPTQMPAFWRALDVAVIGLQDDAFGRYCYPLKLAEIQAAGTPVVFPRIGVFNRAGTAGLGVAAETNDAAGIADALRQQLEQPRAPARAALRWAAQAGRIETLLGAVLA